MAKYLIRALRQLKVGDTDRQPGELVPGAVSWPNLRSYESLQWLERVPVPEDFEGEGAVEYPPPATTSRLSEVLEPERQRPPEVVASPRKQSKSSKAVRCRNCRVRNWLPSSFNEEHSWLCHSCAQPQTISETQAYPSPTSLAEYAESVDARYVDEAGELQQQLWMTKGTEDGDVTEAWKAGVR